MKLGVMKIKKTEADGKVIYKISGRIDTQSAPDLQDDIDALFEKMKKDIEIIAGEYITLEGDGDYDKASQLIATKGIVSPILQKDLDRIAQAGIPKDIYFQQGLQTLGL